MSMKMISHHRKYSSDCFGVYKTKCENMEAMESWRHEDLFRNYFSHYYSWNYLKKVIIFIVKKLRSLLQSLSIKIGLFYVDI